jgi:hypothetical protein
MLTSTFQDAVTSFKGTKAYALSSPEQPPSVAEVEAFERAHGFRLPAEYKESTLQVGSGEIGFTNLFSVSPGPYNIATQRDAVPELPTDFVPISDNGCGDFYGFVLHAGECAPEVYFADHESEFTLTRTEFADLYEYLVRYAFNAA